MEIFGHKFGKNYGLAIQLEKNSRKSFNKIDLQKKYQKKNDIAIILYHGGPEFSIQWTTKFKSWTEDLFNINDMNLSPKADFYLGVSPTWKGVCFDEIFKDAKKISNTENCGLIEMIRKPNKNDKLFAKNFWNKNPKQNGDKVLKAQYLFFEKLANDLKKMGYKKIYYIAHSWSGGLINSWIHQKGDLVFKNINAIFSVAAKLIDNFKGSEFIKEFSIPFYLYNKKTDKYDVLHKQALNQSAIIIDTYISSFFALSKKYDGFWKNISAKNLNKYFTIYTDYDFRMGSLSVQEEELKKEGINLIKIPTQELITYKSSYLKSKPTEFKIQYMESFKWRDTSFHNDLLNYFLNNFIELYNQKDSLKLTPKENTFWELIKKIERI